MTPHASSTFTGTESPSAAAWGLSELGQGLTDSAIRALSKRLAATPNLVSFAGGMPSPDTFPVNAFSRAFERVMQTAGTSALQYGPTDGFLPLREWIAASLPGAKISPEQVLITAGSQQGLDLIGKVLINRGDPVAVETPTYLGALQSLSQYFPRFVPIDSDDGGLQPEQISKCLREAGAPMGSAKLLYTIPNFQNPTGRTLSEARRHALVEACQPEGLPIVEDDPYGALDYAGREHTSLLSLAPQQVIFLGSFSKVLSPGVRLGYLVAPLSVVRKLEQAKQASDLHTSTLIQRVVHEIVKDGFLEGHLQQCRRLYAARAQAMDAALHRHLQGMVRWRRPEGGMFLWLELREDIDAQSLIEPCIASGVAFVPGAPFFAGEARKNTMRLCFSTASEPQIEQGIAALAAVLRQAAAV